ncbi:MAG TPA: hypothetical protein VHV83_04810 [Armatimonadota bacterium]|nr:hypothetical protein [Armatimonadota bacterium]
MRNVHLTLGYCLAILALMLLIAGCGGGSSSQPQVGGDTVTVSFTDQNGSPLNPVYLAFQDGARSWQSVPIAGSGQYTFTLTNAQRKYGIAFVRDSGDNHTHVLYATTRELSNIPFVTDTTSPEVGTLSVGGSVTGNNGTSFAVTCAGRGGFPESINTAYHVYNVPQGTHQLIASNGYWSSGIFTRPTRLWTKNLTVNDNVTDANIDFSGSDSIPLNTQTLSLLPSSNINAFMYFADGATHQFGYANNAATLNYATVPADNMPEGALYHISYSNANENYFSAYSRNPITLDGVTFPTTLDRTVTLTDTTVSWHAYTPTRMYYAVINNGNTDLYACVTPDWFADTPSLTLPVGLATLDGWKDHTYLPTTISDWYIAAEIPSGSLEQFANLMLMDTIDLSTDFSYREIQYADRVFNDNVLRNTMAADGTDNTEAAKDADVRYQDGVFHIHRHKPTH